MLRIVRENDDVSLFVGDKLVWKGTIGEWSRALKDVSVRTIKEVG